MIMIKMKTLLKTKFMYNNNLAYCFIIFLMLGHMLNSKENIKFVSTLTRKTNMAGKSMMSKNTKSQTSTELASNSKALVKVETSVKRNKDIICFGLCVALIIIVVVAITLAVAAGIRKHLQLYPAQRENITLFLKEEDSVYELKLGMCSFAKTANENYRQRMTAMKLNVEILAASLYTEENLDDCENLEEIEGITLQRIRTDVTRVGMSAYTSGNTPRQHQPSAEPEAEIIYTTFAQNQRNLPKPECVDLNRRKQIIDFKKIFDEKFDELPNSTNVENGRETLDENGLDIILDKYCSFAFIPNEEEAAENDEAKKTLNKMYDNFTKTVNAQESVKTTFITISIQSIKLVLSLMKFISGFNVEDVAGKLKDQVKASYDFVSKQIGAPLKVLQMNTLQNSFINLTKKFKDAYIDVQDDNNNNSPDKKISKLFKVLSGLFTIINTLVQVFSNPKHDGGLSKWMNIIQSVITIITNILEYRDKQDVHKYEKWIIILKSVQPVFVIVYMACKLANVPGQIQGQLEIYGNLVTIIIDHIIISLQMKLVFIARESMFENFLKIKNQLRKEKCDMEQKEFENIKVMMNLDENRAGVTNSPLKLPTDFQSHIGSYCKFSPRTCLNIYVNKDIAKYAGGLIFTEETFRKLHSHNFKHGPITDFAPSINYFNDDELIGYGYKVVKRLNNMNINNLLSIRNGKLNHIIICACVQYLDARGQPLNPTPRFEFEIIKNMVFTEIPRKDTGTEFADTSCRQWIDHQTGLAIIRTNERQQVKIKVKVKEHQIRFSYFANLIYVSVEIDASSFTHAQSVKFTWLKKLQMKKRTETLSTDDFKLFNVSQKIKGKNDIELPQIITTFVERQGTLEKGIIYWSEIDPTPLAGVPNAKKRYVVDKEKTESSINGTGFTTKYCNNNCVSKKPILNPNSCLRLYALDLKNEFLADITNIHEHCKKCVTQSESSPKHYITTGNFLPKGEFIKSTNGKYSFGISPDGEYIKIKDLDKCPRYTDNNHNDYDMYSSQINSFWEVESAIVDADGLYFSKKSLYLVKFTCDIFKLKFLAADEKVKEELWDTEPWLQVSECYLQIALKNLGADHRKQVKIKIIWEKLDIPTLQETSDTNNKVAKDDDANDTVNIIENTSNTIILSDNAKLEVLNFKYQLLWALEEEDSSYKKLTNKMHFLSSGDYLDSKFAIENNVKMESNKNEYALNLNSSKESTTTIGTTWLQFEKVNTLRDKKYKMALVTNSPLRLVLNGKGIFKVYTYNSKVVKIYVKKAGHLIEIENNTRETEHEANSRLVITSGGTLSIFNTNNQLIKEFANHNEIQETADSEIKTTFSSRNTVK
jgi:hypothetical protein